VLSFHNVTKTYKLDERTSITPVNNLTLEVNRGEFIVITGRSGTGKTTLLNLASGLVKPTSGSVSINDNDMANLPDKGISSLRSGTIGFIFQFPSLLPSLTVMENVSLPSIFLDNKSKLDVNERALTLLDKLKLLGKHMVYPRQLSAGEQKRAVIARALMNEPQLVLADEPTSDLDNDTENEVMDILLDINTEGVTFVIVTHSLPLVHFATRAFEMQNGTLQALRY